MIKPSEVDTNADGEYSEAELSVLTVNQIKSLAASLGYTITAIRKADIIEQFLEQQG